MTAEETRCLVQLWHSLFHAEVDSEAASLVDTIWVSSYISIVGLSNLLDNGEAKAETLAIHRSCALRFAEARKDLRDVFSVDTDPSVLNANTEILLVFLEERADKYDSTLCKLDRVPHKVHQDLLDSAGVTQ